MRMSVTIETSQRLLGNRPFRLYVAARSLSRFASQIAVVAVGWQVYALTDSAFVLGMVGLVQFVPTLVLVFVAGHAADRFDRRRVLQACALVQAGTALFLALGTYGGWLTVPQIFLAVGVFGIAGAFEGPASAALLPGVAPLGALQRATALATGAAQIAMICGPAFGGFAFAAAPPSPYVVMAAIWLVSAALNGMIPAADDPPPREPISAASLFAGVTFVRNNPTILGTISLDLFAVLLGGATALLPIYARDILMTGPWGLGVLRAAPAVGALVTTAVLARQPISRRVGMRMFQAVIVFGVATAVFAVSTWLWLSILALAIMGAADTVSVVIRLSLVQLATPDAMRGRVGAVNFLFINASNQIGQFESGLTAALFGTMPAALLGGLGTIAVALIWMKLFTTLRDVEKLE